MLKRNKKGFTLIELIVVMAIIGILVMLAMPKFMGYTEKAKLTKIQNDIKVAENKVEELLV
ncbi:MAG: type II secretion system protein [Tissierellia bacterium]|nr:type II secretion system protein [Tissierellia bacterium]